RLVSGCNIASASLLADVLVALAPKRAFATSARRKSRPIGDCWGCSLCPEKRRKSGHSLTAAVQTGEKAFILQRIEQALGLLQIACVEALREPAEQGSEKLAGFIPLTLIAPHAGDARGRAQLE